MNNLGFQICLVAPAFCEAFPNPSDTHYPNFPYLKTVDHGHGATSYQNVNMENFLSVPIPKDLQVDDGREYEIEREYFEGTDDKDHDRILSLDSRHYVNTDVNIEHVIVVTEGTGKIEEKTRQNETAIKLKYLVLKNYSHLIFHQMPKTSTIMKHDRIDSLRMRTFPRVTTKITLMKSSTSITKREGRKVNEKEKWKISISKTQGSARTKFQLRINENVCKMRDK